MQFLSGIKVMDMTQFLSASYCTQILGDFGADVIKIEAPGKGEAYRNYGPKFLNGESTSFLAMNRNKRSLTVNLKDPRGQEALKKLAAECDVLVENFRPGTLKKYGLDYETLSAINPRLIYCSVSGFGVTGPYAHRGGFDLTAQAMSGLMYVTGEADGPPCKVGYPITDIGGGLYSALGVMAALQGRERNGGKGCYVDTSLFEAGVAWGMMASLNHFAAGSVQGRMGSASPQNAPYQAFTVSDGAFTMGTGSDILWEKFCQIFEIEYLMEKPEYADNAKRVANQDKLAEEIEKAIAHLTVDECCRRMDEVGIPNGAIKSIDQVMVDPQVIDRGMILEVEHPVAGKFTNLAFPVHFDGQVPGVDKYPPLLGEHSRDILAELGYSAEEIDTLIADGVTSSTK